MNDQENQVVGVVFSLLPENKRFYKLKSVIYGNLN